MLHDLPNAVDLRVLLKYSSCLTADVVLNMIKILFLPKIFFVWGRGGGGERGGGIYLLFISIRVYNMFECRI